MEDENILALYQSRNEAAIVETNRKYGSYCGAIAYRILMSYDEKSGMDEWSIQWVAPIDPETVVALIFSDGTSQQKIPLES